MRNVFPADLNRLGIRREKVVLIQGQVWRWKDRGRHSLTSACHRSLPRLRPRERNKPAGHRSHSRIRAAESGGIEIQIAVLTSQRSGAIQMKNIMKNIIKHLSLFAVCAAGFVISGCADTNQGATTGQSGNLNNSSAGSTGAGAGSAGFGGPGGSNGTAGGGGYQGGGH